VVLSSGQLAFCGFTICADAFMKLLHGMFLEMPSTWFAYSFVQMGWAALPLKLENPTVELPTRSHPDIEPLPEF
jgi:hypothetical protein